MLTVRFDGTVDRETRSNLFLRFIKLIPVMDLPYVREFGNILFIELLIIY